MLHPEEMPNLIGFVPFGKMKVNLKLAMVWLLVSPKNDIVIRLNLVYESMLCEIVSLFVLRVFCVICCLDNIIVVLLFCCV